MATGDVHRYGAACSWEGSTAVGYDNYDRTHSVEIGQAGEVLSVSSDSAFMGSGELLNPELLLVAAAASCQLLSFLAVAARARIDVVGYSDSACALMPEGHGPMGITEMRLRPVVTVRGEVAVERVEHLVEVAHRECFIANTLNCAFDIEATVLTADA